MSEFRAAWVPFTAGRTLQEAAIAPALTQLTIADMPQLQPADVAVLAAHPTLQQLSAGLGSRRKNDEVTRLLPLPPVHGIERHPALAARTQLP
ncbi:hypothetical protein ACWD69_31565 [Micromonospora chokoriensis]